MKDAARDLAGGVSHNTEGEEVITKAHPATHAEDRPVLLGDSFAHDIDPVIDTAVVFANDDVEEAFPT